MNKCGYCVPENESPDNTATVLLIVVAMVIHVSEEIVNQENCAVAQFVRKLVQFGIATFASLSLV